MKKHGLGAVFEAFFCGRFRARRQDVDEVLFNALLDTCCRLKDCLKRRCCGHFEGILMYFDGFRLISHHFPPLPHVLEGPWPYLKDLKRLESCMNWMRRLQVKPSPITLGILVKTYGQAGDLEKVLAAWDEMEDMDLGACWHGEVRGRLRGNDIDAIRDIYI